MDKVSDTPRTDASYVCHYGDGLGQWVPREFACELERELAASRKETDILTGAVLDLREKLAAQKEQMRVLEEEMLVLGDERNAAVLDAKENMEIANEFKKLMEQYRQHAEAAYKQSHKLEEEFKQYRKDHCGCLLKECPDCFETEMK